MYLLNYRLRKTWLDKCLKSPVSEHPSTSNMANGSKHCWNLNDSSFTIFIDPCEGSSGWKSLSEWYATFEDYLLTHWVPIIGILFLTEAIYCNILRCSYIRSKKDFLNFLFAFCKFSFNFEHFQKKYDPHSWCICELTDSERRG